MHLPVSFFFFYSCVCTPHGFVYAVILCLLGEARELKKPDAPAGVHCFGQAIGVWLLGLVGKGLQMSLVAFLCVSAPEGQSASWPFSYTLVGAKETHTYTPISFSPSLSLVH